MCRKGVTMAEQITATINLPKPSALEDFTDYGFQSCEERATKTVHLAISEKANKQINEIVSKTGEKRSIFCSRIIAEAARCGYKPIEKSVAKNFRINLTSTESICCSLRESDYAKVTALASSLNLKTNDYIRLVLYQALKANSLSGY